ncbi:MAG: alpha/beta hydrolase [Frankiales bacterium]|nr:alpha/beta hydrolase [Frankiales bacterium]
MTMHHFAEVDGHRVFYREAGRRSDPTVVLLHGAPASSHMFRELIPLLADRYHVLAPDYLGFGLSDSPTTAQFPYNFDRLTDLVQGLFGQLGVTRHAIYVQDYGAPIGWRLALRSPERITAIITQNGNGYADGFVAPFWEPLWAYAQNPSGQSEAPLRRALTPDRIRWQYLHGVPHPATVSPDTWISDLQSLRRPGNVEVQLRLFRDYPSNVELYLRLHAYLRRSQVPLLAVWGRNDEIFGPAGARAFTRDLPAAEVHLVDGGHFLLESHLETVSGYVRDFLGRVLARHDPAALTPGDPCAAAANRAAP